MKKSQIIILLLFAFGFYHAQAQDNELTQKGHHEISFEVNDAIPVSILFAFGDIAEGIVNNLIGNKEKVSSSGNSTPFLSLNYNYFVSEKFAVGMNVGYFSDNSKKTYRDKSTDELTYTSDKTSLITITPNIKFIYVKKNRFQFYGRALAGVGLKTEKTKVRNSTETVSKKDNDPWFIFQVMPIGLSYGGDFAVYGEFGFGVKGLFGLGVRYQF